MKYKDLRDFIAQLESQGELKRITAEIDPRLEMTEICDRVLKAGGPAMLFEKPKRPYHSRAGQSVRHAAAGGDGHGAGFGRGIARSRQAARLSERARAAQRPEGCVGETARAEAGARHGAEGAFAARPARKSYGKAKTSTSAGCRSRPAGRATSGR